MNVRVAIKACLLFLVACFPLLFPMTFQKDFFYPEYFYSIAKILLLVVPVAILSLCFFIQNEGSIPRRLLTIAFIATLAGILEYWHHTYVDLGYFFASKQNEVWQRELHYFILRLEPRIAPHSYRFLADSLVRIFEIVSGDFSYAREIYRFSTMVALVYSIFYFARIFLSELGAATAVLLYALVYPISIRYYAGQLTDPLSHLSFVACFIFAYERKYLYFALTLIAGICAKENIAIMAPFFLLYYRGEPKARLWGILYTGIAFFVVMGIRLFVARGNFSYEQISDTPLNWFEENLKHPGWPAQLFFTIGIFVPFIFLQWCKTDRFLRELVLFLAPVLLMACLWFSWLVETRNLIPLVIPLAVITASFIVASFRRKLAC